MKIIRALGWYSSDLLGKRALWAILAGALLFASYNFNVFHLQPFRWTRDKAAYGHNGFADYWGAHGYVPPLRTETFQCDSEQEVMVKIARSKQNSVWQNRGLLAGYEDSAEPYYSQFGLQGQILGTAFRHTPLPLPVWLNTRVRPLVALLTAAVLVSLLLQWYKHVGLATACALGIALALSDWIVFFARSILYAPFLLFLPLSLGWLLPNAKSSRARRGLLLAIAVSCWLKALCGYEYMTSVILSATLGTVYFAALNHRTWRKIAGEVLRIGLVGCAGLLLAVVLHATQLRLYAGSWKGAYGLLHGRVATRLSLAAGDAGAKAAPAAKVLGLTVISYATVSVLTIPLGGHLHVPLYAMILVQAGFAVLAWRRRRRATARAAASMVVTRFQAATIAACWALPCCLSWAVVFPGHMTPHVHFNSILFYLGWLPLLYLSAALLGEDLVLLRNHSDRHDPLC